MEIPSTVRFRQVCCDLFLVAHVDDGFVLIVGQWGLSSATGKQETHPQSHRELHDTLDGAGC